MPNNAVVDDDDDDDDDEEEEESLGRVGDDKIVGVVGVLVVVLPALFGNKVVGVRKACTPRRV